MYKNFGAYTMTVKTCFNGFGDTSVHYIAPKSVHNDLMKRLLTTDIHIVNHEWGHNLI